MLAKVAHESRGPSSDQSLTASALQEILTTLIELEDQGQSAAELRQAAPKTSPQTLELAGLLDAFHQACTSANLLTPSAVRWQLAAAVASAPPEALARIAKREVEVRVGLALPQSRLAWLDALAGHRLVRVFVDRSEAPWAAAGERLLTHLEQRGAQLRLELIPCSRAVC